MHPATSSFANNGNALLGKESIEELICSYNTKPSERNAIASRLFEIAQSTESSTNDRIKAKDGLITLRLHLKASKACLAIARDTQFTDQERFQAAHDCKDKTNQKNDTIQAFQALATCASAQAVTKEDAQKELDQLTNTVKAQAAPSKEEAPTPSITTKTAKPVSSFLPNDISKKGTYQILREKNEVVKLASHNPSYRAKAIEFCLYIAKNQTFNIPERMNAARDCLCFNKEGAVEAFLFISLDPSVPEAIRINAQGELLQVAEQENYFDSIKSLLKTDNANAANVLIRIAKKSQNSIKARYQAIDILKTHNQTNALIESLLSIAEDVSITDEFKKDAFNQCLPFYERMDLQQKFKIAKLYHYLVQNTTKAIEILESISFIPVNDLALKLEIAKELYSLNLIPKAQKLLNEYLNNSSIKINKKLNAIKTIAPDNWKNLTQNFLEDCARTFIKTKVWANAFYGSELPHGVDYSDEVDENKKITGYAQLRKIACSLNQLNPGNPLALKLILDAINNKDFECKAYQTLLTMDGLQSNAAEYCLKFIKNQYNDLSLKKRIEELEILAKKLPPKESIKIHWELVLLYQENKKCSTRNDRSEHENLINYAFDALSKCEDEKVKLANWAIDHNLLSLMMRLINNLTPSTHEATCWKILTDQGLSTDWYLLAIEHLIKNNDDPVHLTTWVISNLNRLYENENTERALKLTATLLLNALKDKQNLFTEKLKIKAFELLTSNSSINTQSSQIEACNAWLSNHKRISNAQMFVCAKILAQNNSYKNQAVNLCKSLILKNFVEQRKDQYNAVSKLLSELCAEILTPEEAEILKNCIPWENPTPEFDVITSQKNQERVEKLLEVFKKIEVDNESFSLDFNNYYKRAQQLENNAPSLSASFYFNIIKNKAKNESIFELAFNRLPDLSPAIKETLTDILIDVSKEEHMNTEFKTRALEVLVQLKNPEEVINEIDTLLIANLKLSLTIALAFSKKHEDTHPQLSTLFLVCAATQINTQTSPNLTLKAELRERLSGFTMPDERGLLEKACLLVGKCEMFNVSERLQAAEILGWHQGEFHNQLEIFKAIHETKDIALTDKIDLGHAVLSLNYESFYPMVESLIGVCSKLLKTKAHATPFEKAKYMSLLAISTDRRHEVTDTILFDTILQCINTKDANAYQTAISTLIKTHGHKLNDDDIYVLEVSIPWQSKSNHERIPLPKDLNHNRIKIKLPPILHKLGFSIDQIKAINKTIIKNIPRLVELNLEFAKSIEAIDPEHSAVLYSTILLIEEQLNHDDIKHYKAFLAHIPQIPKSCMDILCNELTIMTTSRPQPMWIIFRVLEVLITCKNKQEEAQRFYTHLLGIILSCKKAGSDITLPETANIENLKALCLAIKDCHSISFDDHMIAAETLGHYDDQANAQLALYESIIQNAKMTSVQKNDLAVKLLSIDDNRFRELGTNLLLGDMARHTELNQSLLINDILSAHDLQDARNAAHMILFKKMHWTTTDLTYAGMEEQRKINMDAAQTIYNLEPRGTQRHLDAGCALGAIESRTPRNAYARHLMVRDKANEKLDWDTVTFPRAAFGKKPVKVNPKTAFSYPIPTLSEEANIAKHTDMLELFDAVVEEMKRYSHKTSGALLASSIIASNDTLPSVEASIAFIKNKISDAYFRDLFLEKNKANPIAYRAREIVAACKKLSNTLVSDEKPSERSHAVIDWIINTLTCKGGRDEGVRQTFNKLQLSNSLTQGTAEYKEKEGWDEFIKSKLFDTRESILSNLKLPKACAKETGYSGSLLHIQHYQLLLRNVLGITIGTVEPKANPVFDLYTELIIDNIFSAEKNILMKVFLKFYTPEIIRDTLWTAINREAFKPSKAKPGTVEVNAPFYNLLYTQLGEKAASQSLYYDEDTYEFTRLKEKEIISKAGVEYILQHGSTPLVVEADEGDFE